MTTRLYVDKPKTGGPETTLIYTVHLESPEGEILCLSSEPLLEGCRCLYARGIEGNVELWDHEGKLRLSGDVKQLAVLTIEETRKVGPRFRAWRPYTGPKKEDDHGEKQ